jgi:hypothetical protein
VSRKQNLYTGRSGQLAVMAEFLRRGYNTAIPEVDVGDDIFVVRDADGQLSRIQVKAAINKLDNKVAGTFSLSLTQLTKEYEPELHYVFALHDRDMWREFVIVRRDILLELHERRRIGTVATGKLLLYFSFGESELVCGGISLQDWRNNWSNWPEIEH